MMWPVHCVQGSTGAKFHADLVVKPSDIVVQKGTNSAIDSYSGFFDNDHKNQTEMDATFKKHGTSMMPRASPKSRSFASLNFLRAGITHLYFVGVATDFCVGSSVIDAKNIGYHCTLVRAFTICHLTKLPTLHYFHAQITDACRGVAPESTAAMLQSLKSAGILFVESAALLRGIRLRTALALMLVFIAFFLNFKSCNVWLLLQMRA